MSILSEAISDELNRRGGNDPKVKIAAPPEPGFGETVLNNFLSGISMVNGSAAKGLGNQLLALDEAGRKSSYVDSIKNGSSPTMLGRAGKWFNDVGNTYSKGAEILQQRYGTAPKYENMGIIEAVRNGYLTDPRGAAAEISQGAGSSLDFLLLSAIAPEVALPGRALMAARTLPGVGKAAGWLADRGAGEALGKMAGAGLTTTPIDAFTNSAEIIDELRQRGLSESEIAARVRASTLEEMPYDFLNSAILGGLVSGKLGKTIAGKNAGKGRRFLGGLGAAGIDAGSEYFQEGMQQRMTNKYTDKPTGTWYDPLPNEQAASRAGFFGSLLPGIGGTVHTTFFPDNDITTPTPASGTQGNTKPTTGNPALDALNNRPQVDSSGQDIIQLADALSRQNQPQGQTAPTPAPTQGQQGQATPQPQQSRRAVNLDNAGSGEGKTWTKQHDSVSYDGARPETMKALDLLGEWFYNKTGKQLVVTAVTNGKHADGEHSHGAGWKADVNDWGSGAEGTLLGAGDGEKGTLTDEFIRYGQSLGLGMNWEGDHIDVSASGDQWEGEHAGTNFGGLKFGDTAETADTTPQTSQNLRGGTNEEKIWAWLKSEGFTDAAAAGVMGNLRQEAGADFAPDVVENGGKGFNIDGETGYGIAQWTDAGRQRGLQEMAEQMGGDVSDLSVQLAYLKKEMQAYGIWDKVRSADDVATATKIFHDEYERSNDYNAFGNINHRVDYANEYMGKHSGKSYNSDGQTAPVAQTGTQSQGNAPQVDLPQGDTYDAEQQYRDALAILQSGQMTREQRDALFDVARDVRDTPTDMEQDTEVEYYNALDDAIRKRDLATLARILPQDKIVEAIKPHKIKAKSAPAPEKIQTQTPNLNQARREGQQGQPAAGQVQNVLGQNQTGNTQSRKFDNPVDQQQNALRQLQQLAAQTRQAAKSNAIDNTTQNLLTQNQSRVQSQISPTQSTAQNNLTAAAVNDVTSQILGQQNNLRQLQQLAAQGAQAAANNNGLDSATQELLNRNQAQVSPQVSPQSAPTAPQNAPQVEQMPRATSPMQEQIRSEDNGEQEQGQNVQAQMQSQPTPNPRTQGKETRLITDGEREVPARYRVMEAGDIVASHNPDFGTNENYPTELQPRDRGKRQALMQQINTMSQSLRPADLIESRNLNQGAPVVRNDGVVLNGNGRVMAISRAYGLNKAQQYRDALIAKAQELGIDPNEVAKMKNPVLVREVSDNLSGEELQDVTNSTTGGARLGASEQARADAEKLTAHTLDLYVPNEYGDLTTAANQEFVASALRDVANKSEYNAYTDARGAINADGILRVKRAVFALAYGDESVVSKMAESTNDAIKNITNGLSSAAPVVAKVELGIKQGQLKNIPLAPAIVTAVNRLDSLRRQGKSVKSYLRAQGMFAEEADSQEAKTILQFFDSHTRSGRAIGAYLAKAAQIIEAQGNANQVALIESEPLTLAEVLEMARNSVESGGMRSLFDNKQTSATPAAKKKAADSDKQDLTADKANEERATVSPRNDIAQESEIGNSENGNAAKNAEETEAEKQKRIDEEWGTQEERENALLEALGIPRANTAQAESTAKEKTANTDKRKEFAGITFTPDNNNVTMDKVPEENDKNVLAELSRKYNGKYRTDWHNSRTIFFSRKKDAEEFLTQIEADYGATVVRQADKYNGFIKDMSPMQQGKVEKTLSVKEKYKGELLTRGEIVEKIVKNGGKPEVKKTKKGNEYRLYTSENTFVDVKKTEYDYAVYLSKRAKKAASKKESTSEKSNKSKTFHVIDDSDEALEAAWAEIDAIMKRMHSGVPVDVLAPLLKVGLIYVQRGANNFAQFAKSMLERGGEDARGLIRPAWKMVQAYPESRSFNESQVIPALNYIGGEMAKVDGKATFEEVRSKFASLVGEEKAAQYNDLLNVAYKGAYSIFNDKEVSDNELYDNAAEVAERNGEEVSQDGVGESVQHGESRRDGGRSVQARDEADESPDSVGVRGSRAADRGTSGHSGVQAGESADRAGSPGSTELSGSIRDSYEGTARLDDGRTAKDLGAAKERSVNATPEQVNKKTPFKAGSLESIRADLPSLLPEQAEDVVKAEKRLLTDKQNGILFTNGTGTGKTFTGLGVVKRFVNQGKKNIVIVAPTDKVMNDWIHSAKGFFGLDVHKLENTKNPGADGHVIITTYANFGQNKSLVKRDWDLVIADESHHLMNNEKGEKTDAINNLRALTYHRQGFFDRHRNLHAKEYEREEALLQKVTDNTISEAEKDELDKLRGKLREAENAEYKEWEGMKEEDKPKVVFLSATPFAYLPTVDYANGYLFHYDHSKTGNGYNSPDGREAFFIEHFGYRMRYNKLTRPDADVNQDLMEIQFNTWLKETGALSGRTLKVDKDYERGFVLVDSGVGAKIDEGMKIFEEDSSDRNRKYELLGEVVRNRMKGLTGRYLLEAIKAKEAVKLVNEYLGAGKKVVLFHDYKKNAAINPFALTDKELDFGDSSTTQQARREYAQFKREHPELLNLDLGELKSPIEVVQESFGDRARIFNGSVPKKNRQQFVEEFNDDNSGVDVILIQRASGKEGISLHDTTGKHQRVLIDLGLATSPTDIVQTEGRIYRTGVVSNAIIRYLNTGTQFEKTAFASTIAGRASTAENLAMGEEARALKESIVESFNESINDEWEKYLPNTETEGTGGKERDRQREGAVSPYDKAKTYYFARQKKTSKNKAREGVDYYATPEPVGFKMVEWLGLKTGESALEPSAGHGAISRWFPADTRNTIIEPSGELSSSARMTLQGGTTSKVVSGLFENFDLHNKADGIAMNPPFGAGGKTAVDHIAKAYRHLNDGGRLVAILPEGASADAHFNKWFYGENKNGEQVQKPPQGAILTAQIHLPSVTFNRAGTSVATRIVIIDKQIGSAAQEAAEANAGKEIDLRDVDSIKELFDRLENVTMPERINPKDYWGRTTSKPSEIGTKTEEINEFNKQADGLGYKFKITYADSAEGWSNELESKFLQIARKHGGIAVKKSAAFKTEEDCDAFAEEIAPIVDREINSTFHSSVKGQTANGTTHFETGDFTHTKTGETIPQAKFREKVEREVYDKIATLVRNHGGYYSKYSQSFLFQKGGEEDRDAFLREAETLLGAADHEAAKSRTGTATDKELLDSITPVDNDELTTQEKLLSDFSRELGVPLMWVDAHPDLNGRYDPVTGVIQLNRKGEHRINGERNVTHTFWHEVMHWLSYTNPKVYDQWMQYLAEHAPFTREQVATWKKENHRENLQDADAVQEMLCDYFTVGHERVKILRDMAKENPSLAQRFVAWVKRLMDRFVEMFHNPKGKLTTAQKDRFIEVFGKTVNELRDGNGRKIFRVSNNGRDIRLADGRPLPQVSFTAPQAIGAFSFAGTRSQTADHEALARAQEMERTGATPEEIYEETGWIKGKENKWRYEIPDNLDKINFAKLRDRLRTGTGKYALCKLTDIYSNQKLYDAYPFLRDAFVLAEEMDEHTGGYYNSNENDITIHIPLRTIQKPRNSVDEKAVIVHELTHIIQDYEGFAQGTSLEGVQKHRIEALRDKLVEAKAKNNAEEIEQIEQELQDEYAKPAMAYIWDYQNAGGEQEAREVEDRAKYRKWKFDLPTPTIHDSNALIVFGGKKFTMMAKSPIDETTQKSDNVKKAIERVDDDMSLSEVRELFLAEENGALVGAEIAYNALKTKNALNALKGAYENVSIERARFFTTRNIARLAKLLRGYNKAGEGTYLAEDIQRFFDSRTGKSVSGLNALDAKGNNKILESIPGEHRRTIERVEKLLKSNGLKIDTTDPTPNAPFKGGVIERAAKQIEEQKKKSQGQNTPIDVSTLMSANFGGKRTFSLANNVNESSETAPEQSFLDRVFNKMTHRAGINGNKIITEERQAPKDANWLEHIFASPSRIAAKVPVFRPFFRMADTAMNTLTKLRSDFAQEFIEAKDLLKSKEDAESLQSILWEGDTEQKEYTKQELIDDGVKENVAEAYVRIRAMMDKAYKLVDEARRKPQTYTKTVTEKQLRDLRENKFVVIKRVGEDDGKGNRKVTYREFANWKKTYDVDEATLQAFENDEAMQVLSYEKNLDLGDGITDIYHVEVRESIPPLNKLTGYIPHFFHDYFIQVEDGTGKRHVIGSGRTENDAIKKAEEWLKEHKSEDPGKIYISPKTFSFNSLGMDEDSYATVMGDQDYNRMMKKLAKTHDMTLKEAKEMMKDVVSKKNRHRFFGNLKHRKGVEGYEQDMDWVLRHYFNSASRYYAMETEFKPQAISLFERWFGDFNKKYTGMAEYVQDYINDINGNPSTIEQKINDTLNRSAVWRKFVVSAYGERAALQMASTVTGWTSYLCLGYLNASSALLNLTQAINITAYLGELNALPKVFANGFKRTYTPTEQKILLETNVLNDIGMDSGSGYDINRNQASYFSMKGAAGAAANALGALSRKGMILFKTTESAMRKGAVLTAYKKARAEGKTHGEAIEYAKDINRKSNFDYGVADAPNIFRRGSIISQIALQFKKYGFKEVEVMCDMLGKSTSRKQKMLFWGMYFLTCGLMGLPALDWLDKLLDEEPKDFAQRTIMELSGDSEIGKFIGKTALYGLGASTVGIDLSTRAGLTDIIPTPQNASDLAGPAISKPINFCRDVFIKDNYAAGLRDVSPGIYNQYAAWIAGESKGARDRTNNVYNSFYDKMLRAIGFKSLDERLSVEVPKMIRRRENKLSREKQDAIDEYIANPTTANAMRLKELGVKPQTVKQERERKNTDRMGRMREGLSKDATERNKNLLRFAE